MKDSSAGNVPSLRLSPSSERTGPSSASCHWGTTVTSDLLFFSSAGSQHVSHLLTKWRELAACRQARELKNSPNLKFGKRHDGCVSVQEPRLWVCAFVGHVCPCSATSAIPIRRPLLMQPTERHKPRMRLSILPGPRYPRIQRADSKLNRETKMVEVFIYLFLLSQRSLEIHYGSKNLFLQSKFSNLADEIHAAKRCLLKRCYEYRYRSSTNILLLNLDFYQ